MYPSNTNKDSISRVMDNHITTTKNTLIEHKNNMQTSSYYFHIRAEVSYVDLMLNLFFTCYKTDVLASPTEKVPAKLSITSCSSLQQKYF